MIQIIKNPEPVKCKKCGCVFSFEKEDVKDDFVPVDIAFLGRLFPFDKFCRAVRCPICGEPHIVRQF